jgi:hypothetical protein
VYKKPVIVLLDEYDAPIIGLFGADFFQDAMKTLGPFLFGAFKGNENLCKGFMCGILSLGATGISGAINQMKRLSLNDKLFADDFGFTESETFDLIERAQLNVNLDEVRKWYNGYQNIKGTSLYNPWSIGNFIAEQGEFKPYWFNTGDSAFLKRVIGNHMSEFNKQVVELLNGNRVPVGVGQIIDVECLNRVHAMWGLLYMSGYITSVGNEVFLPNHECKHAYYEFFMNWLDIDFVIWKDLFKELCIKGDVLPFLNFVEEILLTSMSFFDFTQESNYHVFVAGLLCTAFETHYLQSNKEAGFGRADLMLVPRDQKNKIGIVFELKHCREESEREERLKEAQEQIRRQRYAHQLKAQAPWLSEVVCVAMVFYKKTMHALIEKIAV